MLKVCPVCRARYESGAKFCQFDGQVLVEGNPDDDPYIGRTLLDQFHIEEVLGSGGMGTVYRAHQQSVDRDVAIKILHPELIQNPDAVRRFKREAKVSTSLDHPNIVRVFLFGQLPDDSLYLVMEHLAGQSLGKLLATEETLELGRALRILLQLCDGIGDAHRHGVIHRDVKPENIFIIDRAGEPDFVKVLDFGIARFLTNEQTALTQSGLIFGTARYISPEGAAGEATDARSDVYSLGVLAYQLLAGVPPFESKSPVSLLMKHIHDKPKPLRNRPDGSAIPGRIADLVMRCLAKHPDIRPHDAHELAIALEEGIESAGLAHHLGGRRFSGTVRGSQSLPPTAPQESRMPPVGALAAATPGMPTPLSIPARPHTPQETLAGAPNPFGSEKMNVPGLYTPSKKKLFALLALMTLAAAVTASGVWLVKVLAEASEASRLADLEDQVRVALIRGHYDRPPGDNVLELTHQLLAAVPNHGPAMSYRKEAAHRLEQEAETAKSQGFDVEAHALYSRALVLNPENRTAQVALAREKRAQDQMAPVPIAEGPVGAEGLPRLELTPSGTLTVGQALRIRFRPSGSLDRVTFLIRGQGRTLRRLPSRKDANGVFEANYQFRSAGRYAVAVEGQDGVQQSLAVRSRQAAAAAARAAAIRGEAPASMEDSGGTFRIPVARSGDSPTPSAMNPSAMNPTSMESPSAMGDGIDWSLPGTRRPDRRPVVSRPLSPSEMATVMAEPTAPTTMATVPPAPWMN